MQEERDVKLEVITPKEVPSYRFSHPYGTITIYGSTSQSFTPEKVYLLLEQAKHDLLAQHIAAAYPKEHE